MENQQRESAQVRFLRRLGRGGRAGLRALFGELRWVPPGWVRSTGRGLLGLGSFARREPLHALALLVALGSVALVVGWGVRAYLSRPRPVTMGVVVLAPELTRLEERLKPHPLVIVFDGSAAPLAAVGKDVAQRIELSPPVEGRWRWLSDSRLTFTPRVDWPVGQEITVTLPRRGLLAESVLLEEYELSFSTAPFAVSFKEAEFHQDPIDPDQKKVVATLSFTHPVDAASLEKSIKLVLLDDTPTPYGFKVSYDKLRGEAYVHSDRVAIPRRDLQMRILIEPGVRAERGGPATAKPLSRLVRVPGIYNAMRVGSLQLTVASDEHNEPVQTLLVTTALGVSEKDLATSLRAWLLPVHHPDQYKQKQQPLRPHVWSNPDLVGPEVLARAERLALSQVPNENRGSTLHSFRFKAEVGRYVYVRVDKGLRSFGGYILGEPYDAIARVPEFPRVLKIAQAGAILSLSGEKKLSIYARDVAGLRVEVGRVLPEQLANLAPQMRSSFANPSFYYGLNEDALTELFVDEHALPKMPPGKGQYYALDLGKYLEAPGGGRKLGLFLLRVQPWDPVTKQVSYESDRRLVLLSNLGLVVKDQADGSHEVFVQSIATGEPVGGAKVEVVGRNGLAVLSATTDAGGRAHLPSLSTYNRTQAPTLYLVRQGHDLAFLPFSGHDRYLNTSRFEVGGVSDRSRPEGLTAYLFSDRGIYRPGDEIRVGMIVKAHEWRRPLKGIPLEVTVTDPRGLLVRRDKLRLGADGFEELKHQTSETGLTGNYVISLQLVQDNQQRTSLGSTTVQVREFLADRMKIQTRLSRRSPAGWVHPKELRATVSLQNLFGMPATGRLVRAELELSPHFPAFRQHRDFVFHNWMPATQTHSERLEEQETDDKGEASFDLRLERFSAGTYLLRFTANGYESEGGRSVVGETSAVVSPLPYLIGYKRDGDFGYLSRGSRRVVELIAIGPDGARRAVAGLRLQLVERKHVSVLTRQPNGTYRFESVRREVSLSERPLSLPAGGLSLSLPTGRAGDFSFVVRDRKNSELTRIDFTVAGEANLTRSLERSSELQLVLKKRDVEPGEELEVQIRAPFAGAGLMTIERDRVYTHRWFKTGTNTTVQRIRVPAELEGNGYLSVSFHRDIGSDQIFVSPLAFGVTPFSISRRRRAVSVKLEHPEQVRPGEPLQIRYQTDRRARLVVFAVDEGILQVAGYRTPDPLGHFLQKRALEVRTAQILDLVLPEFRHLSSAPGGDGDGDGIADQKDAISRNLNPFKRRHDKPVAFWSGLLDSGEQPRQVTYLVPESFNGTLRVMAVAVTAQGVGATERQALVRGDFVISANLPTFVAPGDEFQVSAAVANNVQGSKRAAVSLRVTPSRHLELVGAGTSQLSIAEQREATATFTLRARPVLGSASLTFRAEGAGKSAQITIDLSVRPAAPYLTTLTLGNLRSGEVRVPVPRQLYPEHRLLRASFSSLPLGVAPALQSYLEKFPHGCTEQLVSQAMPALLLRKRPELGMAAEEAEASLKRVIATLRSRQNSEGGFGLWTAHPRTAVFASIYALHFLVDAGERGVEVPEDLLQSGLGWLRRLIATDGDDLAALRQRAYAVYVLTRAGVVTGGPAASLHQRLERRYRTQWKKDLAGIYLAATFRLLRQDRLADELISAAIFGEERGEDYANYYDGLIRDAQLLYVLARHFPRQAGRVSAEGVKALFAPIAGGRYNTLSSAYVLQALEAYAGTATRLGGSRTIHELLPGGGRRALALPAGLVPQVSFSDQASHLVFGAGGGFESFYSVTQAGFDRSPPTSTIKQKLEVHREYRDGNNKVVSNVRRGEDLTVHIRVRALGKGWLPNLAIVDLLPGGFEVVVEPPAAARTEAGDDEEGADRDGEGGEGEGESGSDDARGASAGSSGVSFALPGSTFAPVYADVREDRVVLYGNVGASMQEFIYKIRATTAGRFAAPPLKGESLYDRTVVAQSPGGRITVSK